MRLSPKALVPPVGSLRDIGPMAGQPKSASDPTSAMLGPLTGVPTRGYRGVRAASVAARMPLITNPGVDGQHECRLSA